MANEDTRILGGAGQPAGDQPPVYERGLPPGELPRPKRFVRPRRSSIKIDKSAVAKRITDDLFRDLNDRLQWNELRVQRYAKLRGWLPTKRFPWTNASNAHIPIMMTDSLRVQDSLYNAVMTVTPPITSKAMNKGDMPKQDRLDSLLYTQLFLDQPGEARISELADTFVNDGVMCCFEPWVRENQTISDTHIFDPIPEGQSPDDYLRPLIGLMHRDAISIESKGAYSWNVEVPDKATGGTRSIRFDAYIEEEGGRVELVEVGDMRVFDGPVMMPKSIEDYVVPFRCSNLQPPGPSNPGGASHVILMDYPTIDEIKRLKKSGYYDLLDEDEIAPLEAIQTPVALTGDYNQQLKQIKDDFEGTTPTAYAAHGQPTMTRLTAFYGMDIDGDGIDEQVVVRMIRETKTILRARLLTEEFPSSPARRPLMSQSLIPVKDRFYGISLLELLEPLYDMMKIVLDQTVDSGTIRILPWGFCKAQSGLRNEPISISPGTLIPTNDPQRDVHIPVIGNSADALFMNLLHVYDQWANQLTMISDLNFGQVPQGKATALRTVQGMQSVLQQGDARPEHILRRFFTGLAELHAMAHELNQSFLPKDKEFRMVGVPEQGGDVYQSIADREQIRGRFQFEFKATVLNTSKGLLQQSLSQIASMLLQPLMIQMGIVGPEQAFHLMQDIIKAGGQDAGRYIKPPSPDAMRQKIDARTALSQIAQCVEPDALPLEPGGAQEHLQTIDQLLATPDFTLLPYDPMQRLLLDRWRKKVTSLVQQQAQQQQLMQAAQHFQQSMGMGNGGPGAPSQGKSPAPQSGPAGMPNLSPNEVANESLPSAGGGK